MHKGFRNASEADGTPQSVVTAHVLTFTAYSDIGHVIKEGELTQDASCTARL
jgi:hypothetical protein